MYEEAKLSEADYFYARMMAETSDRDAFVFNLSAFLSSARSVLQYALKEVRTKSGGQQWTDARIIKSNVLAFFKDKRNINIHSEPIKVSKQTTVELTEIIYLSASLSIQHYGADGKLISEYHDTPEPKPMLPDSSAKTTHRFTFPDWSGNEDILLLCRMYLDELRRVVQDGLSEGMLTR